MTYLINHGLEGWMPGVIGFAVFSWAWLHNWGSLMTVFFGGFLTYVLSIALKEWNTWTFRMQPKTHDTCVITGGTHGIGGELAKVFARDGYNLIIIARHEGELRLARDALTRINPNITVLTVAQDLYTADGADVLFEELVALNNLHPQLNMNHLINNVGMCIRGEFLEMSLIDQIGMMQLNMTNCVKLSYKFGNRWKREVASAPNEKTVYRIMNLASFASLIPCPFLSVYSGTKAFVHSFSISFAEELKASKYKDRITCTSLCPGYTDAPSLTSSGVRHSVAWALRNWDTPERVARAGYKALMDGQFYVLVGFLNNLTYWLASTLLPVWVTSKLGKFFNADWEDLTWAKLQKEGLCVSHGWRGDSVAARDLRSGLSSQ